MRYVWKDAIFVASVMFSAIFVQPSIANAQDVESDTSVEEEVRNNVLNQKIGNHTLADYNLPDEFVRRIADRIIRSSYNERYRQVYRDPAAITPPHNPGPPSTQPNVSDTFERNTESIEFQVMPPRLSAAFESYRDSLREMRPENRGFQITLDDSINDHWPIKISHDATGVLKRASDHVASRLARDGLLSTLVDIIDMIGSEQFMSPARESFQLLKQTGFPTDLLVHFTKEGPSREAGFILMIAQQLELGFEPEEIKASFDQYNFKFRKSHPHYRASTESGEHDARMIRLQLTRGDYWIGEGDGGNLDVARQLVQLMPHVQFTILVESKYVEVLRHTMNQWPARPRIPNGVQVVPVESALAQWAQDNAKPGHLAPRLDMIALLPRYPSRGEDGSTFVPEECFAPLPLSPHGKFPDFIHSSLLFQGGNILVVREPNTGKRILLIGEAEIYRNTALGLTYDQAVEAFRVEFGVDRCIVLPAVSFHIDFDLCVRTHDGRLIAFVNDPLAATKLILSCGLDALQRHKVVDEDTATKAKKHLDTNELRKFMDLLAPIIFPRVNADGRYPLSLAELFSESEVDSGVGNFQRFLLALDIVASHLLEEDELPVERHTRSYIQSFRRRDADRKTLHEILTKEGFDVVPVPSLSDAKLSVNYVNGVHLKGKYLMPTYGGLYEPLDDAAETAFKKTLGESVEIVRIHCAESQRRVGGVHCSASVYPAFLHIEHP